MLFSPLFIDKDLINVNIENSLATFLVVFFCRKKQKIKVIDLRIKETGELFEAKENEETKNWICD